MKLEKAIEIFIVSRTAEGYSPNTLEYYGIYLRRLCEHLGNPCLDDIESGDVTKYFAWLRTEYKPARSNGDTSPLKPVSLANHWGALRSFFGWAKLEFDVERPDKNLKAPKHGEPTITPLSQADVQALLKAAEYTKKADTNGRASFCMKRSTSRRDKAIILILLDTGMRVSECARLNVGDVGYPESGNKNPLGDVVIRPYLSGRKSRGRTVHITAATIKALMLYHAEDRPESLYPDDSLFVTIANKPMNRHSIRSVIKGIGKRAGVPDVSPHKFRHTFSIEFLRNGGNPFVLQKLLGHSTLDMVKRYLYIVQSDLAEAQRSASPVLRWRL